MIHTSDPEADWADAILGTDSYAHGGLSRSLQAEVDVYFNDISTVSYSSIMAFWQVSNAIYYYWFSLTPFRRISTAIPQFLLRLSTCPHLIYH